MKIGSLFSGYGGLDMGVQAVIGGEVAWHVEYDKAPSRILAHHWPDIPNFGDVTAVDFTKVEPVDVLTGGYPCQPFSHAGKRKGTNDDRHLWPHVLRAIREMGPSLAVLENVRGHLTLGFDVVLADLADLGWSAEWGLVRASDAGAPHQRARLFIVAYPSSNAGGERCGLSGVRGWSTQAQQVGLGNRKNAAYPSSQRHGQGQDTRGLGRLDSQDAGGAREWEWSREVARDRGAAATADAVSGGRDGRSRQSQRGSVGRVATAGTSEDLPAQPASDNCTPADADVTGSQAWGTESSRAGGQPTPGLGEFVGGAAPISWGDYAPAITRWEHVTGRPAPAPTESGRTGSPRLSPAFVEWMMGLPAGWVTDPAIGISRNDQLKALGNGVVPQQAALALSLLRDHVEAVAA